MFTSYRRLKPALGLKPLLALLLVAFGTPLRTQAVVIDWDTLVWTPGTLINSYDVDPTNPGIDVQISITGTTGKFLSGYPALTRNLTGGLSPAENSLQLFLDWTSRSSTITVTVSFFYPGAIDETSFDLFDIDKSGTTYIDQVSAIQARYNTNPYVGPTITGSASNTVAGSGTGQTITGNNLVADTASFGNATIDFGTNVITQFTFTFGNNSAANSNPGQQAISLYDITYRPRPIPEVHPGFGALAVCGLVVGVRSLRRFKLA